MDCPLINSTKNYGFTLAEKQTFCEGLQDGSLREFVDKAVKEQRRLGRWVSTLLGFLAFFLAWRASAAMAAYNLLSQIRTASANKTMASALPEKPLP
jgi:hypothetical protein